MTIHIFYDKINVIGSVQRTMSKENAMFGNNPFAGMYPGQGEAIFFRQLVKWLKEKKENKKMMRRVKEHAREIGRLGTHRGSRHSI